MRSKGLIHTDTEIQVPFFDIDMMNVVWHGHYIKYLEVARCALLDQDRTTTTSAMREAGYAWPVIDMQLRYVRGAVFGQTINVRASLVEWENRLKINYLISDAVTGERMTRATTVQVAVEIASREMQLASPTIFTDAVERALK
ncbi:acyl-CoA thioesterase [Pseudomonas sp. RTB3]|nr:acyl-CoA thioesterase [Pseudomonas sp. RTB3]